MGLIVYPAFRDPIPETKPRTSGEYLARAFDTLDRIADTYGLPRFTSFSDQREISPDETRAPWEIKEQSGPSEDWYPASEGVTAFEALATLIRDEDEVANSLESPEAVIEELEDLARILALAIASNEDIEFRLELS